MYIIEPDATDQTIDVFIQDSSSAVGAGLTGLVFNTASLTCYYRRGATGTATALALASQTVGGAHTDGGFVELDATNEPGMYRLDLSDAIVATGVPYANLYLHGAANMAPTPCIIVLSLATEETVSTQIWADEPDIYHARIFVTVDSPRDEYTVTWFKNNVRVTSGITGPTIQVIKRVDGTDLIGATAMTQIGSTGSYKYDETSNRLTAGEAAVAVVTGTIDGSSRTDARVVSRDAA